MHDDNSWFAGSKQTYRMFNKKRSLIPEIWGLKGAPNETWLFWHYGGVRGCFCYAVTHFVVASPHLSPTHLTRPGRPFEKHPRFKSPVESKPRQAVYRHSTPLRHGSAMYVKSATAANPDTYFLSAGGVVHWVSRFALFSRIKKASSTEVKTRALYTCQLARH